MKVVVSRDTGQHYIHSSIQIEDLSELTMIRKCLDLFLNKYTIESHPYYDLAQKMYEQMKISNEINVDTQIDIQMRHRQ